ncbi:23003_t:CDS:1, partial [Gigaspora rosea]
MREKLAIITYYENNPTASKHSTARKFNIARNQLREWISKKQEFKSASPIIKRLNV